MNVRNIVFFLWAMSFNYLYAQQSDCGTSAINNVTRCFGPLQTIGQLNVSSKGPIIQRYEGNTYQYSWYFRTQSATQNAIRYILNITFGNGETASHKGISFPEYVEKADHQQVTFSNSEIVNLSMETIKILVRGKATKNSESTDYDKFGNPWHDQDDSETKSNENSSNQTQQSSSQPNQSNSNQNSSQDSQEQQRQQQLALKRQEDSRQNDENIKQSLQQLQSATDQIEKLSNSSVDKDYAEKTQNLEMLKFAETEPEFNTINTPDDYNSVSITTNRNFSNLLKLGQLEIEKYGEVLGVSMDIPRKKAIKRAKLEAAFIGANTVNVKVMNTSFVKSGFYSVPKVDIFAVAYTDKVFNVDVINQLIQKDNSYQISYIYTFFYRNIDNHDTNFEKKESKKNIIIQSITQNPKDKSINITAQINDSKSPSIYKLVSISEDQFVLMIKEGEIDKSVFKNDKNIFKNFVVKLK